MEELKDRLAQVEEEKREAEDNMIRAAHFGKELLAGMISLLLYCSWKLFVDKITTSFNKTYTQQDSM